MATTTKKYTIQLSSHKAFWSFHHKITVLIKSISQSIPIFGVYCKTEWHIQGHSNTNKNITMKVMREKLKQEVTQTQETNGKEEICKRQLTLMNTNTQQHKNETEVGT